MIHLDNELVSFLKEIIQIKVLGCKEDRHVG